MVRRFTEGKDWKNEAITLFHAVIRSGPRADFLWSGGREETGSARERGKSFFPKSKIRPDGGSGFPRGRCGRRIVTGRQFHAQTAAAWTRWRNRDWGRSRGLGPGEALVAGGRAAALGGGLVGRRVAKTPRFRAKKPAGHLTHGAASGSRVVLKKSTDPRTFLF